ncbi:MAG: CagE TrbE VirB component of type transporter system [Subtercola sp.]|nr:CagE TrbE VirB component of type transporter system [Subtercola sp.]
MFNVGVYSNKRGRGLGEFQRRPAVLSDLLPWGFFLGKGLIVNKDGAFQKTIAFRGPDLASSTKEQLVATRGRVNNALRRLGSNWCLHIEARRRPAPHYPKSTFPDVYSAMVDEERRKAFEDRSVQAFESDYFLTFTYLPPAERVGRAEAAMLENTQRASGGLYAAERTRFLDTVSNIVAILEGFMPFVRPLDDDETLTYLHDCVSDQRHGIATPDVPFGLDAILADSHLVGGLQPRLGSLHMRTIGVNAFVGQTVPGVLDALNNLPFGYRWVSRFLPLDKQDATKALTTLRQRWFAKRKGIWTLVKEAVSNSESPLEDADAINKAADANAALEVLGADLASFGYFTPTITIMDEDLNQLEFKRRAVQQVLDQQGLVSRLEDTNAVEAWLSSLPGQAYANCRRPIVSSANLVDLMPLSAIWAGPDRDEHLNGPPLMMTQTAGSTPFRLAIHQGDVGHTMIVGPTGAGKSVLLNFMALQFRRYKGAQVFFFDKGSSARGSTYFVGGEFYALGSGAGDATFQPLANIDGEHDRAWASEWIGGLVVRQNVPLTPELRKEVWDALTGLASRPREQRTMTLFRALVQNAAIKAALEPFAGSGPYADILDANATTLAHGDWQTFEMEALYNRQPAIAPTLDYLFHRLEGRFDGRPTLLVLDEAWLFLDDPLFAGKIREWLKTLRRRNVSVVFASQSLDDIANSKIASALIENCPTRIFLPNDRAEEPKTRELYESFGLSRRQIQIIAQAIPKAQYYYQSRTGNRLFQLGLSPTALTILGSSSKEDLNAMETVLSEFGRDGFGEAFLSHKRSAQLQRRKMHADA